MSKTNSYNHVARQVYVTLYDISKDYPRSLNILYDDIIPEDIDTEWLDILDGCFRYLSKENLENVSHWNTSNIVSFRECFATSYTYSSAIKQMDFSNGKYFDKMFYDSIDEDCYEYLKEMDLSKGVSYDFMCSFHPKLFEDEFFEGIHYESISKMKVNPNASFKGFFSELPKDEAEHFRRWFPDMNIDDIVKKLVRSRQGTECEYVP